MFENTLAVQIITSYSELWALGPEWHSFETTHALDLPFQTWEWSTSWWTHFHEDRPAVRDALRVCVIRKASGELVGIAPLMLTERPGIGPIRVRMLQPIGPDPNMTELRLIVCDPALEAACYRAVMTHLASVTERWDWVVWERPELVAGTPHATADSLVRAEAKSAFIRALPPTWDEFTGELGRNVKQSLRHCYNSLKRDGLTYRFDTLTGPDEVLAALPEFMRLHAARANVSSGVRHRDVFASPRAREFLVEVCQRLAKRGKVRLFRLFVGDTLVSSRIGFAMTDSLYLYYSGWDPEYGRYSVMTTLLAEVFRYAIAQGFGQVNLSTGKDVSKTRWGAREVRYTGGRRLSSRAAARVMHFMYEAAANTRTSKVAWVLTRGSMTDAVSTTEPSAPGFGPGALTGL